MSLTTYTPLMKLVMKFLTSAIEMRPIVALAITFAHAATTALGFTLLGESDLVSSFTQFFYFYIVTGSSVGYGDFSPITDAGKLFAALWVIPGAILLFALLLGKVVATITLAMRKIMNGLGDYSNKTGHVVVVGYDHGQTGQVLDEAKRFHGARDVIIVSVDDISNMVGEWSFVRATSLSNQECLIRAGIRGAEYVVILGKDDDETLAASFAVAANVNEGKDTHVVSYFREQAPATLVESHCPGIETIVSISPQLVARALVDPGAGEVMMALASANEGATLYSLTLAAPAPISVAELRGEMGDCGATLVGYRPCNASTPIMDLSSDTMIKGDQTVYYIASKRIGDTFTPARAVA